MSDGKILKIQEIDKNLRDKMIADLDAKVAAHQSGASDASKVSIREGIYDSSVQKDLERNGPPIIPENFSILQNVQTTKTSVRRPTDYPVLGERFK